MKKIIKLKFIQHLLSIIAAIYIFLVRITSNIQIINLKIPKNYWDNRKPFILAFWHSQLMMISFTWTNKYKINIIASNHSDGRFGALVGRFFKLNNIPRSSKNSNASLKIIYKLVKNNEYIGITPDGPRGPKEKVSAGIIKLASSLEIPIIPCGYWSNRNFQLNSWDRFLITLPFSKCYFVWSDPINIEKEIQNNNISEQQIILEERLNQITQEAKKLSNK
tara:strand:- start:120 stop:782 length:663 start_codon:yes stop_codon:yes gene_type:complete